MFTREAAVKLGSLTLRAPAGGIFTHAIVSDLRVLHAGFANEQYLFDIETPEGNVTVVVKPKGTV